MKDIYSSDNGLRRRAIPCEVTVHSEQFITAKAAIGGNESIEFALTAEEVGKFWALIDAARSAAFKRAVEQNL